MSLAVALADCKNQSRAVRQRSAPQRR